MLATCAKSNELLTFHQTVNEWSSDWQRRLKPEDWKSSRYSCKKIDGSIELTLDMEGDFHSDRVRVLLGGSTVPNPIMERTLGEPIKGVVPLVVAFAKEEMSVQAINNITIIVEATTLPNWQTNIKINSQQFRLAHAPDSVC